MVNFLTSRFQCGWFQPDHPYFYNLRSTQNQEEVRGMTRKSVADFRNAVGASEKGVHRTNDRSQINSIVTAKEKN